MWSRQTRQLIAAAFEEDLDSAGDVTTTLYALGSHDATALLTVREAGVISGLELGPTICELFARHTGEPVQFRSGAGEGSPRADGDTVSAGDVIASVRGAQSAVLALERTLLNFIGRMSGVATLTAQYVRAARAANPNVRILDTRKTIPGWRELDKYAVRCGGGKNHRMGLHDAILIKDNHLAGMPTEALAEHLDGLLSDGLASVSATPDTEPSGSGTTSPGPAFIEVEVDSLEQFEAICEVSAIDIVLLDNFSLPDMARAVAIRDDRDLRGKLAIEASGGVTLDNVGEIAATGVDRISIGALTHSARFLDVGLDM